MRIRPSTRSCAREIDRDIRELDASWSRRCCWPAGSMPRSDMQPELVDLLGLLVEEAARVRGRSRRRAVQVLGDGGCCAARCATCWRTPVATAATRSRPTSARCRTAASRSASAIAAPACRRSSASASSSLLPPARPCRAGAGGVGLGLSLVRQIAERHGGRACAARGREGGGTCFVITLPGPTIAGRRSGARSA